MRSRRISKRGLAFLVGIVVVVWFQPNPDNDMYLFRRELVHGPVMAILQLTTASTLLSRRSSHSEGLHARSGCFRELPYCPLRKPPGNCFQMKNGK
ncbi:hypothetical protein AVEN_227222-1 [Araneus ventricosus]|uniref:Uncharacterized protein n=1 Tax=Araneus ventricosus TaxID=182803 RepID=A0A4Y2T5N7_ARAVE|nr:hypothetical protein AVEN_232357-1 [Araneus ventricosus]GBN95250.1 hypothetical protein AVEN_227222-1 [Araneus ventricosus]